MIVEISVFLNFMFRKYADGRETEEGKKALEMTLETLRKMAMGGIHDHIGQVNAKNGSSTWTFNLGAKM